MTIKYSLHALFDPNLSTWKIIYTSNQFTTPNVTPSNNCIPSVSKGDLICTATYSGDGFRLEPQNNSPDQTWQTAQPFLNTLAKVISQQIHPDFSKNASSLPHTRFLSFSGSAWQALNRLFIKLAEQRWAGNISFCRCSFFFPFWLHNGSQGGFSLSGLNEISGP